MTIDVEATSTIPAPRTRIAAFTMDPANDTRWIGGIREVERVTEPPTRVGSQVKRVARFLGRRIDYVLEVTELEPDRLIVMRSIKAPFPMVVSYAFEDDGAGTRVKLRVQGGSDGFFRLADPLVSGRVRKDLRGDLARLRSLMTAG